MARKDLLSEAIADAKAVKETALANAKLALEEAFTPKLQSMISAKLAEELDDEELDDDELDGEELEEDDLGIEDDELDGEELGEDDLGIEDEEEDEDVFEQDDVVDDEEDEEALDLEAIIRELEMDSDEEEEDVLEYEEEDDVLEYEEEEDDEVDLAEVIRVLQEMGDEEDGVEPEDADIEAELGEAYATIESLQKTINEVNLLNAKLLYTNKLFRTFNLNESQKIKVLENFDRTGSVREVKLVFSTIAENLNVAKKTKKKRVVVKEGYASKVTKSSASKRKIISEGNQMAARWKKLAGLK
jgi:hypothetical protein